MLHEQRLEGALHGGGLPLQVVVGVARIERAVATHRHKGRDRAVK